MALTTLVLGAGEERYPNAVHVDIVALEGIDIVCDLNDHPWPIFGLYKSIVAKDVLEHLCDVVAFIDNCHDLLEPGGLLHIQVPHWQGENAWVDPTHVRAFTERSFDYYDPETQLGAKYHWYTKKKWRLGSCVRVANEIIAVLQKR